MPEPLPIIQGLACLGIGYLFGIFNTAIFLTTLRGKNIRALGSGNPGASNTFLYVGKGLGLLVALIDVLKAWLACTLCRRLFPLLKVAYLLAGLGAVLGHMFPIYLQFRGGKGLACLGGLVLAHDPRLFLGMLLGAVVLMLITRYGTIVAPVASVFFVIYYGVTQKYLPGFILVFVTGGIILWRHGDTVMRILRGQEEKFALPWERE